MGKDQWKSFVPPAILACVALIFLGMTLPEKITPFSILKKDKLALIVTVSEYAAGTDWPSIHTDKDAHLIKYALLQQGFEEEIL